MEDAGTSEDDDIDSEDSNTSIDHGHLARNCSIKIITPAVKASVISEFQQPTYRHHHRQGVLPKGRFFTANSGIMAAVLPKGSLSPKTQEPRLRVGAVASRCFPHYIQQGYLKISPPWLEVDIGKIMCPFFRFPKYADPNFMDTQYCLDVSVRLFMLNLAILNLKSWAHCAELDFYRSIRGRTEPPVVALDYKVNGKTKQTRWRGFK